jgi:hypothetical protein
MFHIEKRKKQPLGHILEGDTDFVNKFIHDSTTIHYSFGWSGNLHKIV